jgi:2-C-methyl-D-erythritol 4-phosphate cytidylyltransferase
LKLLALITPSFATILVAAGQSSRMGFDKLSAPLEERPVLVHSLETFLSHPGLQHLILVGPEALLPLGEEVLARHVGRWSSVPGGGTRAESVRAGLAALAACPGVTPDLLVAVHDAARPLLTTSTLARVLALAAERGNAVCAEPLADSIHQAGADGCLHRTMDRAGWWRMQTPQIFPLAELCEVLHDPDVMAGECTDEAGAFVQKGKPVFVAPADEPNWKITTPADLLLARAWLRESKNGKANAL